MTRLAPDTSKDLQAAVKASITDFFVSTVGAVPCNADDRPVEGMVHVHFSNGALSSPLSFALLEDRVGDIAKALQTLLISEPLPPSIRLERHQPDGPDARSHLDFLQARLPTQSPETLLAAGRPERPLDILRERLAEFATETDRGIPIGVNAPQTVRASVEKLLYDAVVRYYAVVDRGSRQDVAEIVSMFAKDGVYDRAGKILTGRREIADFYTGERTLEGQHQVHSLVVDNLLVHVTGVFEGRSTTHDEPRRLEFADTWRFDLHGFVRFRHTYLSQGHQLTT